MPKLVERRKYRRFEIPGGAARLGKVPGYSSLKPFAASYPLLNACMGGVNILCPMELSTGTDLFIELHAPNEKIIKLHSRVIWTIPVPLSNDVLTGFELFSFGGESELNSLEAMNILRRLYARYIDT